MLMVLCWWILTFSVTSPLTSLLLYIHKKSAAAWHIQKPTVPSERTATLKFPKQAMDVTTLCCRRRRVTQSGCANKFLSPALWYLVASKILKYLTRWPVGWFFSDANNSTTRFCVCAAAFLNLNTTKGEKITNSVAAYIVSEWWVMSWPLAGLDTGEKSGPHGVDVERGRKKWRGSNRVPVLTDQSKGLAGEEWAADGPAAARGQQRKRDGKLDSKGRFLCEKCCFWLWKVLTRLVSRAQSRFGTTPESFS